MFGSGGVGFFRLSKSLAEFAPAGTNKVLILDLQYKYHGKKNRPYSPSRAQRRYQRGKQNCGRKPILANKESLVLIRRLLREEWSPEEIQYRLKREENSLQISYTTIYRALSSGVSWGTGKAIR